MQVIILAAGIGSRLKPITEKKPKCLVYVCNQPILQYQIDYFINDNRIDEILIVVGYRVDLVKKFIESVYNNNPKIILIENKVFLETNNMYSLFLTKNYVSKSFLLINGDVILDPKITDEFINFPAENAIAVDVGQYYEESMKVSQKGAFLIDISKKISKEDALGCSIDFYKFSKKGKEIFFSKMEDIIINRKKRNQWTELAIQEMLNKGTIEMKAYNIKRKAWTEIDNFNDLYEAEIKFNKYIRKLKEKKVFIFDLDRIICLEGDLSNEINDIIIYMKDFGINFFFLSDDSSICTEEYFNKLKNMGLEIEIDNIFIPTHPTNQYSKKEILLFKLRELEFKPREAVIVGDRLYSDIKIDIGAGITTICILTGETSRAMIEESEFKPDIILNRVTDLKNFLK